jgi:ribosomal-protein-alanine N-acetyltransferase
MERTEGSGVMEVEDIYGDLPVLETKRLVLRKITLQDLKDMHEYASNENVSKYVTWNRHRTLSETKEFILFILKHYKQKKITPWGIEYKENGKFIGTIDMVWWQPIHKSAEIGYALSQDYWGKGIMTEAAKKLITFGFEKMDLVRIQARCFTENIGSERVMVKSGMTYEGTIRKAMLIKGTHQDLKLYSILKDEFVSNAAYQKDQISI